MFTLFSSIHILLILLMIPIYYLGTRLKEHTNLIDIISFILFVLEIIKQLYYIHTNRWTVWIVPFQLCSIPLYYWLFYKSKIMKEYIESFTSSYILLGGIFAILFPADMVKSSLLLTLHSFLWHYLLILMSGICIRRSNMKQANIMFIVCCVIATILNVTLARYGEINMFYISPLYPSTQPVFSLITNIHLKNICYIGCMIVAAYIISSIQVYKIKN